MFSLTYHLTLKFTFPHVGIVIIPDPKIGKSGFGDEHAKPAALDRSQASSNSIRVGKIPDASENFLSPHGNALPDIVGQHHWMFADPRDKSSAAYGAFWTGLRDSEIKAGTVHAF